MPQHRSGASPHPPLLQEELDALASSTYAQGTLASSLPSLSALRPRHRTDAPPATQAPRVALPLPLDPTAAQPEPSRTAPPPRATHEQRPSLTGATPTAQPLAAAPPHSRPATATPSTATPSHAPPATEASTTVQAAIARIHHAQEDLALAADAHADAPLLTERLRTLAHAYAHARDAVGRGPAELSRLTTAVGGLLLGPHLDAARILAHFDDADDIAEEAQHGIIPPLQLSPPADNAARLKHGNMPSAHACAPAILSTLINDTRLGRVLLFPLDDAHAPNTFLSPLGGVQQKSKTRTIVNLSYGHSGDPSVNERTDFSRVPPCDIGTVFADFLTHCYHLRLKYPTGHLVFGKVDVADAFRQLRMHPDYASVFSYAWHGLLVVDLRLAFGWTGSPGFFYRWAKHLVAFIQTQRPSDITPEIEAFLDPEWVSCQSIEAAGTHPIVALPPDPLVDLSHVSAVGDDPFFHSGAYIDDTASLEHNIDGRVQALSRTLMLAHFLLFGPPRPGLPPPVKKAKITNFGSTGEFLGVGIDLNRMVVYLPAEKRAELRHLLTTDWPPTRQFATPRELMSLIGKLRSWAYTVRNGRFFVRRIRNAIGARTRPRQLDKPIPLAGTALQVDLSIWRLLLERTHKLETSFASPLFNHVRRLPDVCAISDACQDAAGGYVGPLNVWWQFKWPSVIARLVRLTMQGGLPAHARVTIAHLELAALILNLGVMVDQAERQGLPLDGKAVLALADNTNAVSWVRKAGAKDTRAAQLMVMLGMAEIESNFSTLAKHIPGIDNTIADAATRLPAHQVHNLLLTTPCPITRGPTVWTQVSPPPTLTKRVVTALSATTPAQH